MVHRRSYWTSSSVRVWKRFSERRGETHQFDPSLRVELQTAEGLKQRGNAWDSTAFPRIRAQCRSIHMVTLAAWQESFLYRGTTPPKSFHGTQRYESMPARGLERELKDAGGRLCTSAEVHNDPTWPIVFGHSLLLTYGVVLLRRQYLRLKRTGQRMAYPG